MLSHHARKVSMRFYFIEYFNAMLTFKIFLAVDISTHRETILDAVGPISGLLQRKYHRFASKSILKSYVCENERKAYYFRRQADPADIPIIVCD